MSFQRLLAAGAVLLALTVTAVMLTTLGSPPDPLQATPLPPPTTTSSEVDFAAIVAAENVTAPLVEEEEALTEKVLSAVVQTTVPESTTTSTTAPSTTSSTQKQAAQPKTTTAPPSTTATTSAPSTSPPSTIESGYQSGAEGDFSGLINSYRNANGLDSLSRSGSLDSHARAWAKRMAEQGSIGHSNLGSLLPPWDSVGENVGSGGSVNAIFKALAASSAHNANMLGDYTHVGMGVWRDGKGILWTAHVFAR